eukprot:1149958-Pelagomonas_calceolata.AAC.5
MLGRNESQSRGGPGSYGDIVNMSTHFSLANLLKCERFRGQERAGNVGHSLGHLLESQTAGGYAGEE